MVVNRKGTVGARNLRAARGDAVGGRQQLRRSRLLAVVLPPFKCRPSKMLGGTPTGRSRLPLRIGLAAPLSQFRERVLDEFSRVGHHCPGGSEGVYSTGIGLYVCRQIIGLHGGSIRCEPGDGGRGTKVAIETPAET